MDKKQKLLALLGVVILVLLFWVIKPGKRLSEDLSQKDLGKSSQEPRIVKGEAETILAAFPEGFPLEGGAGLSESFRYLPANSSEEQSTVEYVSKKTLAENGKIFRTYFAKAGFEITNKIEEPKLLFYYLRAQAGDLSVKIKEEDDKITVSASYRKP